jgi:hypothetical protein
MTSTLLNTHRGNTMDLEKEKKQYLDQLGDKEKWLNDESVN